MIIMKMTILINLVLFSPLSIQEAQEEKEEAAYEQTDFILINFQFIFSKTLLIQSCHHFWLLIMKSEPSNIPVFPAHPLSQ